MVVRSVGCLAKKVVLAVLVLSCVVPACMAAEAPATRPVVVTAGQAAVAIEPGTGHVTSILLNERQEMVLSHPAGSEQPFGYLEVVDLRERRTYNPLTAKSAAGDWTVDADGSVRFTQQYEGAAFRVAHRFSPEPAGVRWQATLKLRDGQDENRSLVVTWVLPVQVGWRFWGPSSLAFHTTDGVTPYRYIYGHTDSSPMATIIPLVGVWGRQDGAAIWSPPDVRKSQVIFELRTQGLGDVGTGVFRNVTDLQSLHVAHHQVGLRPGKELTLAIQLAGTRGDWRGVLGHYVRSYPELFEPIPETRRWEGLYGVTTPRSWSRGDRMRRRSRPLLTDARATCVELHGHFHEYGYFITDEQLANPEQEFTCRPHPSGPQSVQDNRRIIDEMAQAGIGAFVYFYNVHSLPDTIAKRYPGEMMVDERGKPALQWHSEPAVVAQPDSAFGRNLLEQLRMLIQAYPQAPGFFVDNYSIQKIDFAHDDGVTMVHNRPCYDLNRNHQDIGTRCHEIAHEAGKVMMVNKLATIESARGADMVLLEGVDSVSMPINALACVNKPFFPLGWEYADRRLAAERGLQHLLIWGGTPGAEYAANDGDSMRAYRPLTDAMIGKRWVFDADPLTLPAGYDGQIFRIDRHAPHAGDVVVSVVKLDNSWRDERFGKDLAVTVRLPEAEELKSATWLAAEKSKDAPVPCEIARDGQAITVKLPPVGAAGVLRFSR